MIRAPRAMLVVAVALFVGTACPPAEVKSKPPPLPSGDCPPPLEPMGVIAQIETLGRLVREARANQMTQVRWKEGGPKVVATLHDPQLTFLEGILADPSAVRRADGAWLARYRARAFVELHSGGPLSLDDQPIVVQGDRGASSPVLYRTERKTRDGMVYHLFFAGQRPAARRSGLRRITLHLPGGGVARWGLSSDNLAAADSLPIVARLSSYGERYRARRRMLLGETAAAIDALKAVARCAPGDRRLRALLAVARTFKAPLAASRLGAATGEEPKLAAADDPLQTKAAMVAWLGAWAKAGLLPQGAIRAAVSVLEKARQATEDEVRAKARIELDRSLGALVQRALDPLSPLAPANDRLAAPALEISLPQLKVALKAFIVRGAAGLVLVAARGAKATAGSVEQLVNVRARLSSGFEVVARAQRRQGAYWIHEGLPPGDYRLQLLDNAERYWLRRVAALTSMEQLKQAAREILAREVHSPSLATAALAMQGLVQLRGLRALKQLKPVIHGRRPARAAAALVALSPLRGQQITALAETFSRAKAPRLRAGALRLLFSRGAGVSRKRLIATMDDPRPMVALVAMIAGLERGEQQAAAKLGARLRGDAVAREAALVALGAAAIKRPATLKRALVSTLQGRRTTAAALGAVARLGGVSVRALAKLYRMAPELGHRILEVTRGPAHLALYKRAARSNDAATRRLATLRLAQLDSPPGPALEAALKDADAGVKLAAHVGLARLGRSGSLLALGSGARGSCQERQMVLAPLVKMMDRASRSKLIQDALASQCASIHDDVWSLATRYASTDVGVLRAALGHRRRRLRVMGALTTLGLHKGAALGSMLAPYLFSER